jgi:hypothetical protein
MTRDVEQSGCRPGRGAVRIAGFKKVRRAIPAKIAASFTMAELAVLTVIARQHPARRGLRLARRRARRLLPDRGSKHLEASPQARARPLGRRFAYVRR